MDHKSKSDRKSLAHNITALQKLLLVALSVMLVAALCPNISRNAAAKAKPKNRWSKTRLYYYSKNGKKVSGITVITERKKNGTVNDSFYVFGKKKKLSARKTLKIRKAARYERNFRRLKKLIGKPIKAKYKRGCYNGPVKKGKAVSSGSHGWAEVNGKVCDPSWQKIHPKKKYFMVKMSKSGKSGYPMYRKARKYVKKI